MSTAHDLRARFDLITGNLVGAYGLPTPNPSPQVASVVAAQASGLPSVVQLATARHPSTESARRSEAQEQDALPRSSATDTLPPDSRGPQVGAQSAAGGGGAASPMVAMDAFALLPAPSLELVPLPPGHHMCPEASRLERPG